MTTIQVIQSDADKSCPYCRFPLKVGITAEQCDSCSALHHEDCWHEGGGCAIFGCVNNAASKGGSAAAPAGKAQKPPIPSLTPAPAPTPAPAAAGAGTSRALLAAAVVLIITLATALIVVVVNTSGSDAPEPAPVSAAPPTEIEDPEPAEDVGATASERAQAKRDIASVLSDHEEAYSNDDENTLTSGLTSDVVRTGQDSGGCQTASGRSEVTAALASNFSGFTTYTLSGARSSDVKLIENSYGELTKATVNARYQVDGSQEKFKIRFVLENGDGDWQISKISSFCDGNEDPY